MMFYNNLVYIIINFCLHRLKLILAYQIYDPEKVGGVQCISRLQFSPTFVFSK